MQFANINPSNLFNIVILIFNVSLQFYTHNNHLLNLNENNSLFAIRSVVIKQKLNELFIMVLGNNSHEIINDDDVEIVPPENLKIPENTLYKPEEYLKIPENDLASSIKKQ